MSGSTDDEFLLKWHDHHASFFLLVEELVMREQLTDVTLACAGLTPDEQQLIPAHSLMLSVCSPYFRSLLTEHRHREKHHIIHLHGVSARHMQQLLVYMYRGEISISQEDLGPLIDTARCLQIKGLAMAHQPPPVSSPSASKKRSVSQTSPSTSDGSSPSSSSSSSSTKLKKTKIRHQRAVSPVTNIGELSVNTSHQPELNCGDLKQEKLDNNIGETKEFITELPDSFYSPKSNPVNTPPLVNLPLLPKPLSVLKTAETRTYLSKLIWLGNGGRRPQYGNPETKPSWWPQHILPWEEMKKMGGRKSVELSHINYTEVLKQCLAVGYEYFGYDPSTYFSTDDQDCSYIIDDVQTVAADDDANSSNGDKHEPPLEIDLDEKPATNQKPPYRVSTNQKQELETEHDQKQILCK